MPQRIEPKDVCRYVRAGSRVFVQGGSGEPTSLLSALCEAGGSCGDAHYVGVFPPGINRWDPASFALGARMTAFFGTPELAPSLATGATRLLPLHYSGIVSYLETFGDFDVALIQVSPPDGSGTCSLGVSVDFVPAALSRTKCVIAEINHSMPTPPGSPRIPLDIIDYVAEVDHPLVEPSADSEDEVSRRLGEIVASLVHDGDTIQMGMGRIPTAVLTALRTRNDLGFHSGLLTEPVLELIKNGNINGARKPTDTGIAVTGIAFGSQPFYQSLGQEPCVAFRPASYTHDLDVIRSLENFVAINSAIEIDLDGQINAEFISGRQVSGIGGLGDFMRGAGLARNGRSIIALPSRAGKGRSRIVSRVEKVTCARVDADIIVTEYGIAELRNKAPNERAEALTAIAAPEFRDQLIKSVI